MAFFIRKDKAYFTKSIHSYSCYFIYKRKTTIEINFLLNWAMALGILQFVSRNLFKYPFLPKMSTNFFPTSLSIDERMLKGIRKIIPDLNNTKYKGHDGRIV